jgi:hypothetical protein
VKKYLPLVISLISSVFCIILIQENLLKALVLLFLIWLWFVLGKLFKSYFLSSIILLVVVFPLNITKSLQGLSYPFVNGIIVNYLIPHISILDLFSCLFIFSILLEKKFAVPKKIYFLFPLLLLVSNIISPSILSVITSVRYVLYALVAIQICWNVGMIKKNMKVIIYVLLSCVSIQLILSIIQVCKGAVIGIPFLGESTIFSASLGASFVSIGGNQILRAYGTFPHPNVLAGFALFSIIFLLFNKKSILTHLIYIFSLSILALTFSRLHIVLGIISIPIYLDLFKKFEIKKGIFSFVFLDRFANIFNGTDVSVNERMLLMKASFTEISKNPWGVGVSKFVKGMEDFVPRTSSQIMLLQPVHNIFLLIIAENGWIVGGALILLLIWGMIKKYILGNLGIKGYFTLFCILCVSLLDHYFLTIPQGIFMFFIAIA